MTKPSHISCVILILFCALAPWSGRALAAAETQLAITLQIPAAVITNVINDSLPVEITSGERLKGLWIESLEDLKLGDNVVSFAVNMSGKDIKYATKIGQQPLELNFGNLRVPLTCNASLRYDRTRKILFVKPRIRPNTGEETTGTAETVVSQLLTLANGHEYPLDLRKIKPITARLKNQALMIQFEPTDMYTAADVLHIRLIPKVTAKQ